MLKQNDIVKVSEKYIHLEEFVDRTMETGQFQALVDKPYDQRDIHKRIIAFYGPPGIGKTMLLDRLEFECVRLGVPFSRINFEAGNHNSAIDILRELVRELDPQARKFTNWTKTEQEWFSYGTVKIEATGQQDGLNVSADTLNVSGDLAVTKMEIKNNTINMQTRAGLNPSEAQAALTQSFVESLEEFVKERPAVILFEGLDHDYCSKNTRDWVDGLLDSIRALKGFGVLPVVTYFNAPNYASIYEPKLKHVTLRAQLKPLSQEHIAEYFRARGMPERMVMENAEACLKETQGIPARVYEYTETNFPVFEEEIIETLLQNPEAQVQDVQESPEVIQAPAPESVESVHENVPVETVLEAVVAVEQTADESSESSHTEISTVESPAAVLSEESISEATVPGTETVQLVREDAKAESAIDQPVMESPPTNLEMGQVEQSMVPDAEVIEEPTTASEPALVSEVSAPEQAQVQEIPEQTQPAAAQSEVPAMDEAPAAEPTVEIETETVVPSETTTVEEPEPPQSVSQPSEEPQAEPITTSSPEAAPVAVDKLGPVQSMPEETRQSEEAFLRSQERAKQLKAEGKSSTAIMIESLLERQNESVADMARRCAVLRWFTADLIAAIADEPLEPGQATQILDAISGWRFVQNFGYGTHAYRREIQQYLRTQLQNQNPDLFAAIHRRALAYFEKQIGPIDTSDEMIWVNLQSHQVTALREYLYYLLHVEPARGFNLLGKLFQSAQRLYMHGEAAILLKFADEIGKSTLSDNYINRLSYYEAALEFAEGNSASAENRLRALMGKTLDDELSAQVQGQLGVICAAGGKLDEAIKLFEQAQKIWQNLKRERERAKLSNNLGNVYMRKNDPSRAERSFSDALNGLNKTGTPSERALTLNNLGNVYMQKENLSKALEHYQKSLEIKKSIGDQFGAANTHSNLGTVYQRMAQEASGKKQAEYRLQAADYYMRSIEAYRTFGARSNQGKLLFKLAYFYYQAGDKAKAKEYLPDALEIFQDLEMPDLENASKLEKQLG